MRKTTLLLACLTLLGACCASEAHAQMMPNWAGPMNQMIQQNMAFDAQMHQNAINTANQFFLNRLNDRIRTGYWGYLPGPVSPGQLSQSIGEMNQAFDDYNQSWARNSDVQSQAVNRWDHAVLRGEDFYGNPSDGSVYSLPYDFQNYNVEAGTIYPGYVPGGENLYLLPGS